jgi:hypothetical protein
MMLWFFFRRRRHRPIDIALLDARKRVRVLSSALREFVSDPHLVHRQEEIMALIDQVNQLNTDLTAIDAALPQTPPSGGDDPAVVAAVEQAQTTVNEIKTKLNLP